MLLLREEEITEEVAAEATVEVEVESAEYAYACIKHCSPAFFGGLYNFAVFTDL